MFPTELHGNSILKLKSSIFSHPFTTVLKYWILFLPFWFFFPSVTFSLLPDSKPLSLMTLKADIYWRGDLRFDFRLWYQKRRREKSKSLTTNWFSTSMWIPFFSRLNPMTTSKTLHPSGRSAVSEGNFWDVPFFSQSDLCRESRAAAWLSINRFCT